MIHIGIDLHAHNMVNKAINNNGEVVRETKLPATKQALADFFEGFNEPVQAVVECTSFWYWLADWCQAHDIPLTLAHAKMTKAISNAKVKTDKVDAKTLAELLRADLIPEAHKVMGAQRDLRELTRGRLRMVQRRERLQSSVWNLTTKYNVHIEEIGWRYPGRLLDWLAERLPQVAMLETRLMAGQIIQLQDHIQQMEQAIEARGEFTADLAYFAGSWRRVSRWMDDPGRNKTSPDSHRTNSLPVTADWFRAAATVAEPPAINPAIRMEINIFVWPSGKRR